MVDYKVAFGDWNDREVVFWLLALSAVLLCRSAAVVSLCSVCSLQCAGLLHARVALLPMKYPLCDKFFRMLVVALFLVISLRRLGREIPPVVWFRAVCAILGGKVVVVVVKH